eukprot:353147-Chlamydomonas_euryale.AAC.2
MNSPPPISSGLSRPRFLLSHQKKAPGLSPNRGCSPFFDGADIVSYITCVYPLSVTTRKHTSSELPTLSKLGHALLHTRGVSRPSALRYSPTHSVWPATLVSLQLCAQASGVAWCGALLRGVAGRGVVLHGLAWYCVAWRGVA